eukprot:1051502-Prymnesium_polylepis.1
MPASTLSVVQRVHASSASHLRRLNDAPINGSGISRRELDAAAGIAVARCAIVSARFIAGHAFMSN